MFRGIFQLKDTSAAAGCKGLSAVRKLLYSPPELFHPGRRRGLRMSRKGADAAESESKAALRRQMEDARESISETVAEIKSVVTHQYEEVRETVESVREGVGEVLDWRTEFERNPLVWGAGAVSVGILVGFGIARAFDEKEEP